MLTASAAATCFGGRRRNPAWVGHCGEPPFGKMPAFGNAFETIMTR
jgi:hypothetical protein